MEKNSTFAEKMISGCPEALQRNLDLWCSKHFRRNDIWNGEI